MKTIKYIIFLMLILFIGFSVYIAVQPNSFEIEKSRTINAPAAVIYNHVIDFKTWKSWSPWVEEKPDTKMMLSEQTKGEGSLLTWSGDDGSSTIKTIDTKANTSITQEMQLIDYPKSQLNWTFIPNDDGGTDVKWHMQVENLPFLVKASALILGGIEDRIGPYFERGLVLLDKDIKKDMKRYSITVEGLTQHSGGFYLYTTTSCKMSNFKEKMQEEFAKVGAYALTHNITRAGKPFVIYHKWDELNDATIFSCAIPTNSRMVANDPEILTGQLESFTAVKTTLHGDYVNLKEAWQNTMTFIENNDLKAPESGTRLEVYVTDPNTTPNPAHWKTELFMAIEK